jgi:hypothetical protein
MLRFFREAGLRVLGVDPARDIARAATASGIETLPEFLTLDLAREIRRVRGPAKVVCANNVCAHIDDLESAVVAVRELMDPDGVFVLQVSYLLDVYEKALFDTMYHEHVDYHRVGPLRRFFERLGMRLGSARRVEAQGGSLRAYVRLEGRGDEPRPSVEALEAAERAAGLDRPEALRGLAERIRRAGLELTALLDGLRARGCSLAAYGAPAKATTLMYHFGLDGSVIDYIVEDNPRKHGLLTPGLHVPIVPVDWLYERAPRYVVTLAWNFAESIIANHRRYTERGGRFVIPLPALSVR